MTHDSAGRSRSDTPPPVETHTKCRTADGLDLHCRAWIPEHPRAALVMVHGLAEHGGRYRETAGFFAAHGFAVAAGDLRGHGLSPDSPGGGRVHVQRFEDYLQDAAAFIAAGRQAAPGQALYLLGHSMGGLITLSYLLRNPADVDGAIVSSPALGTHPDFKPPWVLRLLVGLLSRVAPRARFPSDLDTEAISRDPEVVRAYAEDPLVSNKVSARWYVEIVKAMKRAHAEAPMLRRPLLLMQSGSDRLVDPAATERWSAAAPSDCIEFVRWPGFYHEMFNEPEKEKVRARALAWLEARLGAPAGENAGPPGGPAPGSPRPVFDQS
jgi:alpha-beta hydrolase superfamily lysophospholipase